MRADFELVSLNTENCEKTATQYIWVPAVADLIFN